MIYQFTSQCGNDKLQGKIEAESKSQAEALVAHKFNYRKTGSGYKTVQGNAVTISVK